MAPVTMAAKRSATNKDENSNSHNSSSQKTILASARPQEQALKCPRCDSQNTKFCYFNNYSLTQPRHFCKTCRRYWTKGGALRNVPIGGGCRKNKKSKPSSRFTVDLRDTNISSDIGGLKFFHGLTPAMDFQLGGLNSFPSILNSHSSSTDHFTQFSSFGAFSSSPCFNLDPSGSSARSLMGFNFPFSSIESLSSINQELHWKLQQQRMAMLFGTATSTTTAGENNQKEPILFHNLENTTPRTDPCGVDDISRKEGTNGSNLSTEWFFDSNPYATASSLTPTNNSCNDGTDNQNHVKNTNWNGMNQAWGNLSQYSSL